MNSTPEKAMSDIRWAESSLSKSTYMEPVYVRRWTIVQYIRLYYFFLSQNDCTIYKYIHKDLPCDIMQTVYEQSMQVHTVKFKNRHKHASHKEHSRLI